MTTSDLKTEQRLRQGFKKYLNPFMLATWRLGFGRWFKLWPQVSGNILVLRHTGRRSGQPRYQPLNYARVQGELYCVAAFGEASDWYRNLRANPATRVWLPGENWAGVVEDCSDSPQRIALIRQVLIGSGWTAPAMGLKPRKMSDAQIAAASEKYRLLHIRRVGASSGPGSPGDLEWVWQLTTLALLGLFLLRRRQPARCNLLPSNTSK